MSPSPTTKSSKAIENEEEIRDPFSVESTKSEIPVETETIPDKEKEKMREEVLHEISEAEKPVKKATPPQVAVPPTVPVIDKSESLIIIEDILAADLEEVYFKMDMPTQKKFKEEGERVSIKIEELLKETKDQTHKIFKLIFNWLKLIPGVKKFFLNQEAKLKADKIMRIKR